MIALAALTLTERTHHMHRILARQYSITLIPAAIGRGIRLESALGATDPKIQIDQTLADHSARLAHHIRRLHTVSITKLHPVLASLLLSRKLRKDHQALYRLGVNGFTYNGKADVYLGGLIDHPYKWQNQEIHETTPCSNPKNINALGLTRRPSPCRAQVGEFPATSNS